jgi:hypothetical protein
MPDLNNDIAVAKAKVDEAAQAMYSVRYQIDPQDCIKAYVDSAIEYKLLLAQKEAAHA